MHVRKLSAREPGDLCPALLCRPVGEGQGRTTHVYGAEESEWAIVPAKDSNKDEKSLAESLEGRACTKENPSSSQRWVQCG